MVSKIFFYSEFPNIPEKFEEEMGERCQNQSFLLSANSKKLMS